MKIVIFGASGKTGHELVRQSLAQGHLVTAFVRTPSKLKIADDNLRIFKSDISDYDRVAEAVDGQEAVFSTLGAASPFRYDQSVVDGIGNMIRAMEQKKVKRLIYMSAINVEESRRHAGLLVKVLAKTLLRTETAGHEAREKLIRKSRLDWTIIRPATLSNGSRKGHYRIGEVLKSKGILTGISRADVADFMLRQLSESTFIGKAATIMY